MDASARRIRVACLGLIVATTAAACDSNKTRIVAIGSVLQPTPATVASANFLAQIQPQTLFRQQLLAFGCPSFPPLMTTFEIVVQGSRVDLFLNAVTVRFIDGTGLSGTAIPFPTVDLNRMFGQTVIRAGNVRAFPFTTRFGCFPRSPTLLSAQIALFDAAGLSRESTLTATIQ